MFGDLRYALRRLVRVPGFTIAAVASLTLGIAASTTVFSLLHGALLRPPPFADARQLVVLNVTQHTPASGEFRLRWSWPQFRLLQGMVSTLEQIASSSNVVVTLTGVDVPEPIRIEVVSSGYMNVLRAPFELGRGFTTREDDAATASPAVILAYDFWRSRFGEARDVIGREVELNGVPLRVAGVAGPGFAGVSGHAQAWIPAPMAARVSYADYLTTGQNFITVIGRLRRGVDAAAARAEMAVVGPRIHAELPNEADTPEDRFSATVTSLNEARADTGTRRALLLLAAASGVLLLIACANVASLLLGRAAARRQEVALRLAIGASRRQLLRQLLVESAVLAALAGILGVVVAGWMTAVLRIPPALARGRNFYGAIGEFAEPSMDAGVLLFAVGLCVCTVLLFGLVPALGATRADLVEDLKSGARSVHGGGPRFGLREFAVCAQIALAIVLVVGCGLLLTSYLRLRQAPLGFDTGGLLTFMIRPSEVKYTPQTAPALLDHVLEEVARVPGVEGVTLDGCAPLTVQCASAALHIVGRPWSNAVDAPVVMRHYVAPEHFRTLGIPLLRGRALSDDDRAGRARVVVINQAAADRFWPGEDPIGRRVWFDAAPAFGSADSSAEIVGVVGNVAYRPLDDAPVQPGFFTHYAQFTYPTRMLLVRMAAEPSALVPLIAQAVRRVDPDLALFDVQTMEQRASLSWSRHSAQTVVFAFIAVVALALALTGVYAVASFYVLSRMRELGVRIALGASATQVVRASLHRTAVLGAFGGATGLFGALALSRVLQATLYETSPLDPAVYAATIAVLLFALAAASSIPARRALRINPVDVLRTE